MGGLHHLVSARVALRASLSAGVLWRRAQNPEKGAAMARGEAGLVGQIESAHWLPVGISQPQLLEQLIVPGGTKPRHTHAVGDSLNSRPITGNPGMPPGPVMRQMLDVLRLGGPAESERNLATIRINTDARPSSRTFAPFMSCKWRFRHRADSLLASEDHELVCPD